MRNVQFLSLKSLSLVMAQFLHKMAQDTLQVPGSGRFETVGSVYSTDVE